MHLLGVILDVLLLLRAKHPPPGTESLVWRNVLLRSHREADTQGGEEGERKRKRTAQNTQLLLLVSLTRVSCQKNGSIRQRVNLKVNVG